MKLKIIVLMLLASCVIIHNSMAQSFFKPVPKVKATAMRYNTGNPFAAPRTALPAVAPKDSTMNAIRPILNVAAYAEPGNILMAGAGISYQHLRFDQPSQKWYCEWSVSGMGWAGGSVAPSTPAQAVSYGIMFGILNNMIMAGPALNGKKLQAVVSIGISLNN